MIGGKFNQHTWTDAPFTALRRCVVSICFVCLATSVALQLRVKLASSSQNHVVVLHNVMGPALGVYCRAYCVRDICSSNKQERTNLIFSREKWEGHIFEETSTERPSPDRNATAQELGRVFARTDKRIDTLLSCSLLMETD
eukprot:3433283-Amphidinium_carterae.1